MKKAKHGKHGINKEETESKKKISKKVVYIIIAIVVLILVGAAIILGLSHMEGINLGNILNREENVEIVVEENQSEEIKKEFPPYDKPISPYRSNFIDLTGQQFGELKVLYRGKNTNSGGAG